MEYLGAVDILVFTIFLIGVVFIAFRHSRGGNKEASSFFLAGRGLSWWLIGFSLIAANISTEQFVGMSGSAASHIGLAIASYEWMAAITLIVVAFAFLPTFLRAGIYTMPEFLERRFSAAARSVMAGFTVLIYMLLLGAVTYSGAITMKTLLANAGIVIDLWMPSVVIAVIAMAYVVSGGLKAAVWADLIQGSALIIGGAILLYFAFDMLAAADTATTVTNIATGEIAQVPLQPDAGALARFTELNSNRLNMFLPADDSVLPWTALLLGLWIPNFYYWGLNQYITQRTLGANSLADGQKGIVFAAYLKLVIPFVVVIPGMIAFNLYSDDMRLEARQDQTKAMVMYQAANPDSQFVVAQQAPSLDAVKQWQGPRYLIATYPTAQATQQALLIRNPFVLPLTAQQVQQFHENLAVYQRFDLNADRAWQHLNPELAKEIQGYNTRVEKAAEQNQGQLSTQALIGYKYDTALAQLLAQTLPNNSGLVGFVLAALLGAVISSLAAMLNAASSIFTMDIFNKHIRRDASSQTLVKVGRRGVVVFALIAAVLAPMLGNPNLSNSIFTIIQEGQGLLSPGVLAVFIMGLGVKRCPRAAGIVGLVTNIIAYPLLKVLCPDINFLNRMAICFGLCLAIMIAMALITPLAEPFKLEANTSVVLTRSAGARIAGLVCILLTALLYLTFSPLGIVE